MAIESVPTNPPGPTAMGIQDASVYMGWIQSMGEVLMHADGVDSRVVANYGGLILALAESADELMQKELQEAREAQPKGGGDTGS